MGFFDTIMQKLRGSKAPDVVKEKAEVATKKAGEVADRVKEKLPDSVTDKAAVAKEKAGEVAGKVKEKLPDSVNEKLDAVKEKVSKSDDAATTAYGDATDAMGGMAATTRDALGDAVGGPAAGGGAAASFDDAAAEAKRAAKEQYQGERDAAGDTFGTP